MTNGNLQILKGFEQTEIIRRIFYRSLSIFSIYTLIALIGVLSSLFLITISYSFAYIIAFLMIILSSISTYYYNYHRINKYRIPILKENFGFFLSGLLFRSILMLLLWLFVVIYFHFTGYQAYIILAILCGATPNIISLILQLLAGFFINKIEFRTVEIPKLKFFIFQASTKIISLLGYLGLIDLIV